MSMKRFLRANPRLTVKTDALAKIIFLTVLLFLLRISYGFSSYLCKKSYQLYNCFDISKKFLEFASVEGSFIDPMKLLKLTYIAHGYYLGLFDKPLISNEIQAWKYGPVIPDLYYVLKPFSKGNVDPHVMQILYDKDLLDSDEEFLNTIWNAYKGYNALQLSTKTHQEGSPWHQVYSPHKRFAPISNDVIKKYYKDFIN